MTYLFSDLDSTLIFSKRYFEGTELEKEMICIDQVEDHQYSFVHPEVQGKLLKLQQDQRFIPVTARNFRQYSRMSLLDYKKTQYAVISSGEVVLYYGEVDKEYQKHIAQTFKKEMRQLEKAEYILQKYFIPFRQMSEYTFLIKYHDVEEIWERHQEQILLELHLLGYHAMVTKTDTSHPQIIVQIQDLNKGFAVEYLQKKIRPAYSIASGDSEPDVSMLNVVHECIISPSFCLPNLKGQKKTILEESGIAFSRKLVRQLQY